MKLKGMKYEQRNRKEKRAKFVHENPCSHGKWQNSCTNFSEDEIAIFKMFYELSS